jgi:hypothetical protein
MAGDKKKVSSKEGLGSKFQLNFRYLVISRVSLELIPPAGEPSSQAFSMLKKKLKKTRRNATQTSDFLSASGRSVFLYLSNFWLYFYWSLLSVSDPDRYALILDGWIRIQEGLGITKLQFFIQKIK